FMVKKLREAGAIMLAKVNLSEFAGSGGSVSGATDPAIIKAGSVPNGSSSAGGQTKKPPQLPQRPARSSGGAEGAGGGRFRAIWPGHRYRRICPWPIVSQRNCRSKADARAPQSRRHRAAGALVRHGWADGA